MAYGYQRSMTEISHVRMRAMTTFFSRDARRIHLRDICVHAASGGAEDRSRTAFFLAIGVPLCDVTLTLFSHPESISWPTAFSLSAKSLMGSTLFFRMSGACCTMG
jgi:hypothetical protein